MENSPTTPFHDVIRQRLGEIPTELREVWVSMRHPRCHGWYRCIITWWLSLVGAWGGGLITVLGLALLWPQSGDSLLGVVVVLAVGLVVGAPLGALAMQLVLVLLLQSIALISDLLVRSEDSESVGEDGS